MCEFIVEPAIESLKYIFEQENISANLPDIEGKTVNELIRSFKVLRYSIPAHYEVFSRSSKGGAISNKDGIVLALDICNDLIADLLEYRDSIPTDHETIEKLTRENSKLKSGLKYVKELVNSSLEVIEDEKQVDATDDNDKLQKLLADL
jgi:hypothetical protein